MSPPSTQTSHPTLARLGGSGAPKSKKSEKIVPLARQSREISTFSRAKVGNSRDFFTFFNLHLENLDQPLANVVFDNRLLLADADNDYNLALGSAGRARWLAQVDAQSGQALSTALATLATAGLGGDSSLITHPSPLTPPTPELGWLSGNTPYYASAWNSPLGLSWYGSYDYGYGWHGAGNLFGYGFGNGFYDTGYWGVGEWGTGAANSAFYLSGSDYGGWWGNWSYAGRVFNTYNLISTLAKPRFAIIKLLVAELF